MRQVTDTNRIFQHRRMLSGLPTLVLTADCQSWWHCAKWKCNPLLVLFLMLMFTNWLQTRETYILYSYRAFLNRLMAKQMTALFKYNHINEPLLENNTNTDNGEWELICPAALCHCVSVHACGWDIFYCWTWSKKIPTVVTNVCKMTDSKTH